MKTCKISVVIVTRDRRDEVVDAMESVYDQTVKPNEVVVVVNDSSDDTEKVIRNKFPDAEVVVSGQNLGGAGGRNLGFEKTSCKYILFMDDDAEADKKMFEELVKVLEKDKKIGIVQPKIYDKQKKDVLQGVGHGINLVTGRVYGIGVGEKDEGKYEKDMEVPMVGCTWMVKRGVFEEIGLYDEDIFIPYEDSDFSMRARKAGFKIVYAHKAKAWHQGPKDTGVENRLQWLGITTPERAYRVSRNKMIFMKKHAPFINLVFFSLFLVPIYAFLHSTIMLYSRRFDILVDYWKGIFSGYSYLLR